LAHRKKRGDCRGSRPGLAAPMGKHTYHRSPGTPIRTRTTVTLPVFGGVVFLVGSVFFWPGLQEWAGYLGASLFVFGSACYLAAPIIDWYELTYTHKLPEPTDPPGSVGHYEWLYASQMLHTQRTNAILYAVGSVCFVAGSVLFFPALRAQSTHGAWLYLTGCVCIFLGALLAAFTAVELRKTAEPHYFEKKWWWLWWCSDESAQVISCVLYMLGNANFAAGSICIFPKSAHAPARPRTPSRRKRGKGAMRASAWETLHGRCVCGVEGRAHVVGVGGGPTLESLCSPIGFATP